MNLRKPFGTASGLLILPPIGYLTFLLLGGASSGFAAWNDVGRLMILTAISSTLGIACSLVSIQRHETSVMGNIALIVHIIFVLLLAQVFMQ